MATISIKIILYSSQYKKKTEKISILSFYHSFLMIWVVHMSRALIWFWSLFDTINNLILMITMFDFTTSSWSMELIELNKPKHSDKLRWCKITFSRVMCFTLCFIFVWRILIRKMFFLLWINSMDSKGLCKSFVTNQFTLSILNITLWWKKNFQDEVLWNFC